MKQRVILELGELESNAFAMMNAFRVAARQQGLEEADIEAVLKECRSGDYDHMLFTLIENTVPPGSDRHHYI